MGKYLTAADPQRLSQVLGGTEPVLVEFWASWCKPCFLLARELDELGGEYEGKITMVKVNMDDHPDVGGTYGVVSLPTILFFKSGQEAYRAIGALPKVKIQKVIEKVLAG